MLQDIESSEVGPDLPPLLMVERCDDSVEIQTRWDLTADDLDAVMRGLQHLYYEMIGQPEHWC
jgi:hypothetical protein